MLPPHGAWVTETISLQASQPMVDLCIVRENVDSTFLTFVLTFGRQASVVPNICVFLLWFFFLNYTFKLRHVIVGGLLCV